MSNFGVDMRALKQEETEADAEDIALANNDLAEDDELDRRDRLKEVAILMPPANGCLRIFILVAAIILLLSGIALIILGAVDDNSTVFLSSITVFRTGAAPTATTVDALPAPVITVLNNINVTLNYGITQVLAAVAFFVLYFLFESAMGEVKYGSNGYLWGAAIAALVFYETLIAVRCGLQDLTVLIFDGLLHFSILALFLCGDLLNQRFYRETMRQLNQGRFSYAFLVLAGILYIGVWGMQFVALGEAESGVGGAPLVDISVPIIAAIMELLLFVVAGLHYGGVTYVADTYARDVAVVALIFATLIIVEWLDVILFFTTNFINPTAT